MRGGGLPVLNLQHVLFTESFFLPLSKILKCVCPSSPYLITHQVQDKANDKLTADLYLTPGGNVICTPPSGQQTSAPSASLFFFSVAG